MIYDTLKNCEMYFPLGERLQRGLEYLQTTDIKNLAVGKYEIDGEKIFVLVQEYETKFVGDCKWESHKAYIDIQYVADGCEMMGIANIGALTVKEDLTPAQDMIYYKGSGEINCFRVSAGEFAIFFPQDAHMPSLNDEPNAPVKVKKAVVKVLL